ncbi:MAG: lytic transglycosylase domain-containing protein [Sphingopyxis sp.]
MPLASHRGRSAAATPRQRRGALSVFAAALALLPASATAASQTASVAAPAAAPRHLYAQHVAEAARRFGIPESWILHVMHVESRGKPRAVSRAGAMGLMQIMPATWSMLSARHGLGSDPFDVRANILAGAAYLRAMWDRYRSVPLMLAAYNAGPGRADAFAAGRRGLPAETLAYVARLAPALGTRGDTPAPAARHEPPSWRDASLFSRQHDGRLETMGERSPSASMMSSDALFVRLSGGEE